MHYAHEPVLLQECIQALNLKPHGSYVDCTVGGAGHSLGILATEPTIELIGIDRDPEAITRARHRLVNYSHRVLLVQANFRDLRQILADAGVEQVDGVLMDIGVSSPQLDAGERGFSYHQDARLDMRMDPSQPLDAWTLVNKSSQDELARLIYNYGEERWAARISEFIVRYRQAAPIETTGDLVAVIKKAIPAGARRGGPHPARRTFQALRIAVNDELGALEVALKEAFAVLKADGRLVVITFHSLEDRIVKNYFQKLQGQCQCPPGLPVCRCEQKAVGRLITRKPIVASAREISNNPRARSAKLRAVEKL